MRYDEFKRRTMAFGNKMIDSYFPCENNIINKVANNVCKYIMKNKINTIDPYLSMFANSEGEIDIQDFVDYMSTNMIGDGMKINLHEYVSIVPDRTLTITKEDLQSFLN